MSAYGNTIDPSLPDEYNTFDKRKALLKERKLSLQTYEAHGIPSKIAAIDAFIISLTYKSFVHDEIDEIDYSDCDEVPDSP